MTINVSSKQLFKIVQIALLVAILSLLLWSKPWDSSTESEARTITVSGASTIEEEPDEFTFSPYFQRTGADQQALQEELNTLANDAVAKLKELGVEEKNITLNASSYDRWYYDEGEEGTLTVSLEIVMPAGDGVQTVQDYLLTLDVKGQISPRATFSTDKQKELDARAVEEASNDAKSKAEAQAKLFGAKLGKVVSVTQGSNSIFGYYGDTVSAVAEDFAISSSLPVLPGENDYSQTVTVIYELQ
jgi:uncharacterized protein YggE